VTSNIAPSTAESDVDSFDLYESGSPATLDDNVFCCPSVKEDAADPTENYADKNIVVHGKVPRSCKVNYGAAKHTVVNLTANTNSTDLDTITVQNVPETIADGSRRNFCPRRTWQVVIRRTMRKRKGTDSELVGVKNDTVPPRRTFLARAAPSTPVDNNKTRNIFRGPKKAKRFKLATNSLRLALLPDTTAAVCRVGGVRKTPFGFPSTADCGILEIKKRLVARDKRAREKVV